MTRKDWYEYKREESVCYQHDLLDKLPDITKERMEYLNAAGISCLGYLCNIPIGQIGQL